MIYDQRMNYDGYGELGLIRFGLLLLICSYFERIMFMGYGLREAHGNGSVLYFFSNIRVRSDTDMGTLYQVFLCFTLALLSSLNYILID
jgi:hypothetical protein